MQNRLGRSLLGVELIANMVKTGRFGPAFRGKNRSAGQIRYF